MNGFARIASLPAAAALAALLAVPAVQAQETTVNGLIDLSVGSAKAPGGSRASNINSGNMTTSWFGLKGGEDLGGGLSAVFAIESFMRSDTGSAGRFDADTFWARNAYVGLAGKDWGKVTFGRNTTTLFVSTLVFNAFGDSFGFSPSIRHYFTSGTVTGDTGWSDSVLYSSPNFNGLSFNVMGAMSESNGGSNFGGNVMYFNGPLAATFAYQDVKKGATVDDSRTWQLGGSYSFGPAKLFAQVGNVKNKTTGNDYDIFGVGGSYEITPQGKALVQFSQLKPETGNKRTTFSLGYDHFLSKRTDAYLALMSDKISNVGTGDAVALGVRHRF